MRTAIGAGLLVLAALLVAGCAHASGTTPSAGPAPTSGGTTVTAVGSPTGTPVGDVVASTAAIPDAALPRVRFVAADGGVVNLGVEVPPADEYGVGLSGRRTLGERGMLFYFPGGSDAAFWMLNTHIDLDIAFVDDGLHVLDVQTMTAESRDLHRPPASARYVAAIEAPAGWYAAHGIERGAAVTFEFDVDAATAR